MPTFTVIVTTHDRPKLLGRALHSIKAQEGVSVQTIVVADRACPSTQAMVSRMLDGDDIFVQRCGAPGPADSRNLGMDLAAGDNVVFLDDDDTLSLRFLAQAAERADGRTVLYADFSVILERFDDDAALILDAGRRSLADRSVDDLYVKNFIPLACLVYPRAALAGRRYDASLVLNEDWDFLLNVMAGSPLRHAPIDGFEVHTRVTPDNRGRSNDHLLVPTYLQIYANWPAPTVEIRLARQAFFASVGLQVPLSDV